MTTRTIESEMPIVPPPPDPPRMSQPSSPPPDAWARSIEAWSRGRASAELATGLDPEQEARVEALRAAVDLVSSADIAGTPAGITGTVLDVAEDFAGWIRIGRRPDGSRIWLDETCDCGATTTRKRPEPPLGADLEDIPQWERDLLERHVGQPAAPTQSAATPPAAADPHPDTPGGAGDGSYALPAIIGRVTLEPTVDGPVREVLLVSPEAWQRRERLADAAQQWLGVYERGGSSLDELRSADRTLAAAVDALGGDQPAEPAPEPDSGPVPELDRLRDEALSRLGGGDGTRTLPGSPEPAGGGGGDDAN